MGGVNRHMLAPMNIRTTVTALCALATLCTAPLAIADDDDAARAARWKALQEAIFGNRPVQDGAQVITLDAPPRALDAALVPIGLELSGNKPVKSVYLVIDNNPSPLAAHITFGPNADPRSVK